MSFDTFRLNRDVSDLTRFRSASGEDRLLEFAKGLCFLTLLRFLFKGATGLCSTIFVGVGLGFDEGRVGRPDILAPPGGGLSAPGLLFSLPLVFFDAF